MSEFITSRRSGPIRCGKVDAGKRNIVAFEIVEQRGTLVSAASDDPETECLMR